MPGPYGSTIDRRGRRLWILIDEKDWELIEAQAKRRYMSASGLLSQIAAEWCDERMNALRCQAEEEDRVDALEKRARAE